MYINVLHSHLFGALKDSIFPDSLYRSLHPQKKKRGSSCLWLRDKLTAQEIESYAVKMGQHRSGPKANAPGIYAMANTF